MSTKNSFGRKISSFGRTLRLSVVVVMRLTVGVVTICSMISRGLGTVPPFRRRPWKRRSAHRVIAGRAASNSSAYAPSGSFCVNQGCLRRSSSFLNALTGMLASGECQLTHGILSSFISSAPLRWLSNGPLPWLRDRSASRELPANIHIPPWPER